jgi:Bacterial regulatory proteins, tetR family
MPESLTAVPQPRMSWRRCVAREAEVAEQTVYNYFPTKEQLVTDRD